MSLTALPVSTSDLTTLQAGVQFFTNTGQATSEAAAINASGSTQSVFTYAASLINSNISLSQVAMAVSAIAESGTIAVGDTTTSNTLTFLSTQFLPGQVAYAASLGLNQTVFAAQALGLGLASTTGFQTDWAGLSGSAFVTSAAGATGVNASAINGWLTYWVNFYTANGTPGGLSVLSAAYGATLGEAIGVALLNPTSANLQSVFSTISGNSFSPNAGSGLVQNALIDVATGQYVVGDSLAALPTHTPLQGQSQPAIIFTLTTGVDTVALTQSNSTVNGTYGGQGSGETWTAGDTITASPGTTNQTFNIDGIGTAFVLNVTSQGPGNAVSGVETVNIVSNVGPNGVSNQAIQGNFTATGPEGDWTGLTALNVTSAGNAAGVDVLTVDPTTAVTIGDNLIANTNAVLTVNGGSTIAITENNGFFHNDGITVNGGTGTTSVSIIQTENFDGRDGIVNITDAGTTTSPETLGTLTTVLLDGLTGGTSSGSTHNTIVDNALTNLTVNNTDSDGAILDITNTMTTTLNLSLTHNDYFLEINDINSEYSTVHLTLGNTNSALEFNDNGLTTLDTPTAGTGALDAAFNDNVAAPASFDFSGLNGANDIDVNRGSTLNHDVYTLGNFGSNNGVGGDLQELTIFNTNPANNATINFGSGAYLIDVPAHTGGNYTFNDTAPNGAGLTGLTFASTSGQWAILEGAKTNDTISFVDPVQTAHAVGLVGSVLAGIDTALGTTGAHTASDFIVAGNTFIFDHADTSSTLSAADALVEVTGVHAITVTTSHIVTLA